MNNKKWWLTPIILVLMLVALLIVMSRLGRGAVYLHAVLIDHSRGVHFE